VVYSRKIDGKDYTFGVSGRLYKSNVVLYDHQTESLWSQLMEKAVAGSLAGKALNKIESTRTSWKDWKRRHPQTLVLSTNTGYARDYSQDPYEGYYRLGTLWFPVGEVRKDLPVKEMVLGVELDGKAKAYPLSELRERAGGTLEDKIGGTGIRIDISPEGTVTGAKRQDGETLKPIFSYWFAWQAFHPRTEVYQE